MKISKLQKLKLASWPLLSQIAPKLVAKWAQTLFLTPQRIDRPGSEDDYFKSAKKFMIQNKIAAYEWGLPRHPLVVLVHGWGGRGTQLGAFAAPLVQNGYRVVALDGPAHGGSQGTTTHVGEYSQFLIDVQSELGTYHTVIAHSFGAGCSVLSASRGLKVNSFVLIAGPSRYERVVRSFLTSIQLSERSQNYFINSLAEKVQLPVSEMNVGKIGNQMTMKALIIHDRDDKEVPVPAAEEIKSHWPTAELMITSGLGHRRILKDPAVIQRVINFIKS